MKAIPNAIDPASETDLLDEIVELVCSVASPKREHVPRGELVSMLRALFASGQKLAIENAQLRAMLKSVL